MTGLLASMLLLLSPVTEPVACGPKLEFRMLHGLIPEAGWTSVPGIPFQSEMDFAEMTYCHGPERAFRVLSSGSTAGFRPSVGSWVTSNGYAGYLNASGVSVRLWELGGGTGAGLSFRQASLEARNLNGDDPDLFGEWASSRIMAAAGERAFTAGFTVPLASGLLVGPAWCGGEPGRFWLMSRMDYGPFSFSSGGALLDSICRRRLSARVLCGPLALTAAWDEDELLGTAVTSILSCSLSVDPLQPGFCIVYGPGGNPLAALSHGEGGEMKGEVQISISGLTAGLTLERETGNRWKTGFIAGIAISQEP